MKHVEVDSFCIAGRVKLHCEEALLNDRFFFFVRGYSFLTQGCLKYYISGVIAACVSIDSFTVM